MPVEELSMQQMHEKLSMQYYDQSAMDVCTICNIQIFGALRVLNQQIGYAFPET